MLINKSFSVSFFLFVFLLSLDQFFKLDLSYVFVTYVANQTSKEKEAKFPNANALLGPRPQLMNC